MIIGKLIKLRIFSTQRLVESMHNGGYAPIRPIFLRSSAKILVAPYRARPPSPPRGEALRVSALRSLEFWFLVVLLVLNRYIFSYLDIYPEKVCGFLNSFFLHPLINLYSRGSTIFLIN